MRISDWSSDVCSSDLQQWPEEGAVEGRDAHAAAAIVRLGGQAATVAGRPSLCRASCAVATRRPYCPQSTATRATSSADRKRVGEGKRVSVRVDHGGLSDSKKKI